MKISEDVIAQRVEDEAVLLDLGTGQYYGLTSVATRCWELLEEGHSQAEMSALLAQEFNATEEQIAADLEGFFAELEKKHLISQ